MVMTGTRFGRPVAVAVVVAFVASVALAAVVVRAAAQPNEVTKWNRITADTLFLFPPAAGGAPPALQIHFAMTQGAVYDAVNAIEPRHRPYLLAATFDAGASKEAAVATAAYTVLSDIVSTVPSSITFANRAALLTSLATHYAAALAAIADSPSKTEGIAAGNAAAQAMIAARQTDGRFGPSQWRPNRDAGHWWPLLNAAGAQILDPTPWVGGVQPFVVKSALQFRTDGPLALDSAAYVEDFNEVKALGSINSTTRTDEQTHIALWWQSPGGPSLLWNAVARDLVEDPARGIDIGDSALLFAKLNLGGADAAITCWSDKYYWDFWRPWQAIREADRDDNPATVADTSWTALLTAPYPDHPSGHLCLDGAQLEVLQKFFRTDKIHFSVISRAFPAETREFDRFSEPLKEIIDARIWAGLHFRTPDVQAAVMGQKVVHYMATHWFQPLD